MLTQIQLLPGAISEIFASATETGILTLGDRYGLMAATLDEGLDREERRAVNRLLHFVKQGHITVTSDALSLSKRHQQCAELVEVSPVTRY